MVSRGMKGTKWKIFTTAIEMFAEKNYHLVSLRDIAKAVGIKASSIYNHFESKEDLLDEILDYFEFHIEQKIPDLDLLLARAEQETPHDVFMSCVILFEPAVAERLYDIIKIAASEMRTNAHAGRLVNDYLIETPSIYVRSLLTRLSEMGKIAPVDIELIALMTSSFCFSSALRRDTINEVSTDEWVNGLTMIFQQVRPLSVGQITAAI